MNSCRRSACVLVALLACLALGRGAAYADTTADKRADELLTAGQKLFAEGNYPEAIEKLRAGFVLSPQPRFLYSLGQAYRLNHQCKEAVKAYRDFVKSDPSRSQVAAAEANIERCASEDPASVVPEPEVKPDPVATPAVVVVEAPAPAPKKTPVYKKWWLWTTVSVVIVGAGLGVGLGLGLRNRNASFDATLPEVGPNAIR